MKQIFLSVLLLAVVTGITENAGAQKNKPNPGKTKQVIILKDGGKNTKLTIETKNGETFINGKPASEFKDDNVSVITGKDGNSFVYSPGNKMHLFNDMDWNGEKRAFLGVTTEKDDKGVKITNVEKGSAADKAGLTEGDIITKLGDKNVSDPADLADAVTAHKPKDEVTVSYERNGKTNDVKAILGETQSMFKSFSFNGPDLKMNGEMFKEFNKNFNNDFNYKMPLPGAGKDFRYYRAPGNRRIGVRIEDAENDGGAEITNVEEESVAAKAGLRKDDIITEVNGKKVKDVGEVLEQVRNNSDKTAYTIKAKRKGSEMSFEIKIPKKKNNADL